RDLRADSERNSDAHASMRSRVDTASGLVNRDRLAREVERLMAVDDEDRVARDNVAHLLAQAQRMNRHLVRMEQRRLPFLPRAMPRRKLRGPPRLLAAVEFPGSLFGELLEHHLRVANDPDLDAAVM